MEKIYLHSRTNDFAPTQHLCETRYLGRKQGSAGKMRLASCDCDAPRLERINRRWWMRILPLFRLYECQSCGAHVYRVRRRSSSVYVRMYARQQASRSRYWLVRLREN